MTMADYLVFGLRVRSSISLPELFVAKSTAEADVVVDLGEVPPAPANAPSVWGLTGNGVRAILTVANIARFQISDGERIVVDRAADATAADVRLFLLGSALGAVLHQRGLLPLHANAIKIGGGAAAFMGRSGAGKSTMAAAFLDRGFALLADDVCVVTGDAGRPMAQPGLPRLRLWRDSIEASGRRPDDFEIAFAGQEKYVVPTHSGHARNATPLERIYLLDELAPGETGQNIRRLTGIEAVSAVMANIYRGQYLKLLGGSEVSYRQCLELVRTVPVFAVQRQLGYDVMEDQIRAIESHVCSEALV